MGFMDKLQFWKRDEGFDENPFGSPTDMSTPNPYDTQQHNDPFGQHQDPFAQPQHASLGQQHPIRSANDPSTNPLNNPYSAVEMIRKGSISEVQQQSQNQNHPGHDMMAKDMEILSSKLDAIRSSLDSMNQRLQNIERMAKNNDYNF